MRQYGRKQYKNQPEDKKEKPDSLLSIEKI